MSRLLPLLLLLVACREAVPPTRVGTYEFSPRLEDGFPITFRWTPEALPVRVWAEPVFDLPTFAGEAIRLWQGTAMYGEFAGVLVRDSSRADVILRLAAAEDINPSAQGAPLDCGGYTKLGVGLDTTITLPFRTSVYPRLGATEDEAHRCLRAVVAHELGHSLGLFLHSDDPDDLMFQQPRHQGLSARDHATFATLYHTPPTVGIPAGR